LKKKLIFIELFYVFRNLLRNAKLQLEKKKLNARSNKRNTEIARVEEMFTARPLNQSVATSRAN